MPGCNDDIFTGMQARAFDIVAVADKVVGDRGWHGQQVRGVDGSHVVPGRHIALEHRRPRTDDRGYRSVHSDIIGPATCSARKRTLPPLPPETSMVPPRTSRRPPDAFQRDATAAERRLTAAIRLAVSVITTDRCRRKSRYCRHRPAPPSTVPVIVTLPASVLRSKFSTCVTPSSTTSPLRILE